MMPQDTHPTEPPTPRRSMIAIASGKGGVGKTWLAITLAHALALQSRRVLLFDGDLGLANVDIQLDLMPKQDVASVIAGQATLMGAIQDFTKGGFHIIAGRSGSGTLANVTHNQILSLRSELIRLSNRYDAVVIDLGAGIDRSVRQLAAPAGIILVVTNDEPTALTDAYAFIKLTRSARSDADLRIVVNMASGQAEGERTYRTLAEACRGFLKFQPPLAGIIRRDTRVRDAIRSQSPILLMAAQSDAATDVTQIAARLLLEAP